MTLSPSLAPSGSRPWEKQQLSSAARLGLFVLTIVLSSALIVALIIVLVFAVDSSSKTGPGFGAAAVATLVGLVCAGGLYWSIPLQRRSVRFKLRYTPPPPTTLAHPFDVRYAGNVLRARSLTGQGGARFDAEGLTVHGSLEPPQALQLVVFLSLTLVPLLLFGVGLGALLAILVTRQIGRREITRTIPYSEMRELKLEGVRVTFRCDGQPNRVAFAVAEADGERLYRELLARFPGLLGGWTL